jgi:CRISPR-associated protein Csd1
LISANEDAFLSYGLEASLIAHTCASCGERFTKALTELLSSSSSRVFLGGAVFVFWTRKDVDFDFLTYLTDPTPEGVQALYETVWRGGPQPEVDDSAFYAVELSGSGGRAVVRDWIDTTVSEAKRHLGDWFERQRVTGPNGDPQRPLGVRSLGGATVRELGDLAPPVARPLVRAALTGGAVPIDLLNQAVRRNRAEQRVTGPRAALIKLVLRASAVEGKEDDMVELNVNSENAGYRCGRLLAVLEVIQRAAIPGVNATIVDRFYGTASSAPASVFSRLVRGAQPHLAKLERDQRGLYGVLQGRLEEILAGLTDFPRTLSLLDQGRFAVGFYHQRGADRRTAREAVARRAIATTQEEKLPVDATPSEEDSIG